MNTDYILNSKMIGLFMGRDYENMKTATIAILTPKDSKYHCSWDWVIPCIVKFKSLDINNDNYRAWVQTLDSCVIDEYDIKQVYEELIQAIRWYNNR